MTFHQNNISTWRLICFLNHCVLLSLTLLLSLPGKPLPSTSEYLAKYSLTVDIFATTNDEAIKAWFTSTREQWILENQVRVSQTVKQDMFSHRLVQLSGQSNNDPRKVKFLKELRFILTMFHIHVNNNCSARAPIPWKKKLVDSPSLCPQRIWCNYSQHFYLK